MGNTDNKTKKSIKSLSNLNTDSPLTQRSSSKNIKNRKLNIEPKEENVEIKQLKSLSDNKLIQISSETNREEILSNSDTNPSSIKSIDIPYVDEDEIGSEADEDSVKSADYKNKNKNKVLIITNNIKKVFVDSKLNNNNTNNNNKEQSSNSSLSDMKTDDMTEEEENNNNNKTEISSSSNPLRAFPVYELTASFKSPKSSL